MEGVRGSSAKIIHDSAELVARCRRLFTGSLVVVPVGQRNHTSQVSGKQVILHSIVSSHKAEADISIRKDRQRGGAAGDCAQGGIGGNHVESPTTLSRINSDESVGRAKASRARIRHPIGVPLV